jgi:hypothetical protein
LTGYCAVLAINCGCDVSAETIAINCQIHSSGLVTLVGVNAKDDRDRSGLIASLVVIGAVGSLYLLDVGSTGLPLHRKVVMSNWELSNTADNSVSSILRKGIVIVNIELEVKKRSTKLGVDEHHLVLVKTLDEVRSTLLVEPKLVQRLKVDNWWSQEVDDWSVLLLVDNLAVFDIPAVQWKNTKIGIISEDTDLKGHGLVLIKVSHWHAHELSYTWKSVGDGSKQRE